MRGVRAGSISARCRDGREVPELRLAGRWLEDAGFDLGQEYEIEVGVGSPGGLNAAHSDTARTSPCRMPAGDR